MQKRNALVACHTLVQELRLSHREEFFRYFRMSPERLDHPLSIVGPRLVKDCRSREPISPGERLAVTIRFLASGDSQRSLFYAYRISCSSLSRILSETCHIIKVGPKLTFFGIISLRFFLEDGHKNKTYVPKIGLFSPKSAYCSHFF